MKASIRSLTMAGLVSTTGLVVGGTEPQHLIPFQGHLAQPGDAGEYVPVPSGQYDVLYTLYAAPVGGESKVWGPERHSGVVVVNGLVNAMLGSVIGFEDALAANANFFARPLYVGITIDADGNPATADLELVPRQVLLPSVYAHNASALDGGDWRTFFVGTDNEATFTEGATKARDAELLDGYDWDDVFDNGDPTTGKIAGAKIADASIIGGQIASETIVTGNLSPELTLDTVIPVGTINAFAGATPPDGWLICDGSIVSATNYPRLFAALGTIWGAGETEVENDFHLPDMRGMFLRGTMGDRADGFGDHDFDTRLESAPGGNTGNEVGTFQGDEIITHRHHFSRTAWFAAEKIGGGRRFSATDADNFFKTNEPTTATGGSETRPQNVAVLYIIKY